MLKKTITYTDYNGIERTEDFYFNYTKAELMEKEWSKDGGLSNTLQKIISNLDNTKIIPLFKEIILDSYGEKSDDGKRFIKSQELKDAFAQTEAYSILFMELATDEEASKNFINGIIPEVSK